MKKLYKAFFYVPKYGKVQDRVMTARAVLSLTVILLCLASMAITAYAWFSYNISSPPIRLMAARFSTVAVIRETGGGEVTVDSRENGTHTAQLSGGSVYEVVLTRAADCTADTGFCILSGGGAGTYHTSQLSRDSETGLNGLTFYLSPKENMQITLQDHWGTSSSYGDPNATNRVENGQTLILSKTVMESRPAMPPITTPTQMLYEVREGDTLSAIAQRFGITVEELCQLNGVKDPDVILVGDRIRIPTKEEEE